MFKKAQNGHLRIFQIVSYNQGLYDLNDVFSLWLREALKKTLSVTNVTNRVRKCFLRLPLAVLGGKAVSECDIIL